MQTNKCGADSGLSIMASSSPVALDGSLGVFEIASVLATWLFGIETLQTFNYYSDFPKDPKILKALVCLSALEIRSGS
jgi:hypothetical protein